LTSREQSKVLNAVFDVFLCVIFSFIFIKSLNLVHRRQP
jgi:hypothetical protein